MIIFYRELEFLFNCKNLHCLDVYCVIISIFVKQSNTGNTESVYVPAPAPARSPSTGNIFAIIFITCDLSSKDNVAR